MSANSKPTMRATVAAALTSFVLAPLSGAAEGAVDAQPVLDPASCQTIPVSCDGSDGAFVAKAVIHHLRQNDGALSGSLDRIPTTWASSPGVWSVVIAANSNRPEYNAHLAEIGAAGIGAEGKSTPWDGNFATTTFCLINDLGHSDIAGGLQCQSRRSAATTAGCNLNATAQTAAICPSDLTRLAMTLEEGTPIISDAMMGAIIAETPADAERFVAAGDTMPARGDPVVIARRGRAKSHKNNLITLEDYSVEEIDRGVFLNFVVGINTSKIVPAFDSTVNTDHPYLRRVMVDPDATFAVELAFYHIVREHPSVLGLMGQTLLDDPVWR